MHVTLSICCLASTMMSANWAMRDSMPQNTCTSRSFHIAEVYSSHITSMKLSIHVALHGAGHRLMTMAGHGFLVAWPIMRN